MKTSLKNAAAENAVAPDTTALAEIEDSAVATADVSSFGAIGSVSGSVSARDLIIPRLGLVQGVGPLSEMFSPGDLVLNGETRLIKYDKEKVQTLDIIVLTMAKTYEEKLPYSPTGPFARKYKTLDEVLADGLTVDWVKGKPEPTAREVAEALILIKKPEGIESASFNFDIAGGQYALAMWTMRSTAYSRAAKRIFSAAALELQKTGLVSGKWTLNTSREQINGNWVFVPVLRLVATNTPEVTQSIIALVKR